MDLGVLYYRRGNRKDAKRYFELATQVNPRFALALNNLGYLLAEEGKLDEALILCSRASELEETSQNVDSLGYVYLRMGQREKARTLIARALELDPNNREAKEHWAELAGLEAE
ncbi:MAG TPA: tetratricopeptide repeat protein [Kiritimatiellia bacterium]|nr:tetratricopeptide repeat protein [Kiritimatiellia bacterium]